MSIIIYSKPNCPHCVKAKELLSQNGFEFTELIVGEDVTRETVLEKFPGATMVPIIVVGTVRIEGSDVLKNLIERKQLSAFL